ncbi:MAG: response regulator transcription factor [Bacteroidota bacterium]
MINILLVDDHKIIRDGLRFYFEDKENLYFVKDEAESGEEALLKIEKTGYDLLLTDISMPRMDGIELVEKVKEITPNLKIIVLTMIGEGKFIKKMISLGVDGFLLKNAGEDELLFAIDKVYKGDSYFSLDVTNALINDMQYKKNLGDKYAPKMSLRVDLTKREIEILKLILAEKSNQEIADELFISIRTVETHKGHLLGKTGAKNLAGLVFYAIENKLIE